MAVDSSHIYWPDVSARTTNVADLNGANVTVLETGQAGAAGVAVDSSHIYWTSAFDAGFNPNAGTVMAANPDGSGATTLVSGQDEPLGVAVGPN